MISYGIKYSFESTKASNQVQLSLKYDFMMMQLIFFYRPNAQSKKDLESQSKKDRIIYTKQGKELSLKISKDLDVDELQAYDMVPFLLLKRV